MPHELVVSKCLWIYILELMVPLSCNNISLLLNNYSIYIVRERESNFLVELQYKKLHWLGLDVMTCFSQDWWCRIGSINSLLPGVVRV